MVAQADPFVQCRKQLAVQPVTAYGSCSYLHRPLITLRQPAFSLLRLSTVQASGLCCGTVELMVLQPQSSGLSYSQTVR